MNEDITDSIFVELDIYREVYYYCLNNGESKELEYIVATHARWSYNHALDVIEGRFKLAEDFMNMIPHAKNDYDLLLEYHYEKFI